VYVVDRFGGWHAKVLNALASLYDEQASSFPSDAFQQASCTCPFLCVTHLLRWDVTAAAASAVSNCLLFCDLQLLGILNEDPELGSMDQKTLKQTGENGALPDHSCVPHEGLVSTEY
jgi:hypothetical protein